MHVETPNEIEEYYKDKDIVKKYISKRFTSPIYQLIHQKQVNAINKVIREINPKKLLEIAPGPARLTAELEYENGISLDSSEEMLNIAKERMKGKPWRFIKGDAFNLNFENESDLILAFRFIFHFKKEKRDEIYASINKALKKNGFLMFDAINLKKAKKIRKIVGKDGYEVYDKLYTKKELIEELERNNFKNIRLLKSIKRFWTQMLISKISEKIKIQKIGMKIIKKLEKIKGGDPYEWIVICQKK